mmetsp:Transcript_2560/g.5399  ORF Transcript_2560/g.5399 Transcript_2560/m.5399 type:complete len:277 (-) Transcript_2560:1198-2028(-)
MSSCACLAHLNCVGSCRFSGLRSVLSEPRSMLATMPERPPDTVVAALARCFFEMPKSPTASAWGACFTTTSCHSVCMRCHIPASLRTQPGLDDMYSSQHSACTMSPTSSPSPAIFIVRPEKRPVMAQAGSPQRAHGGARPMSNASLHSLWTAPWQQSPSGYRATPVNLNKSENAPYNQIPARDRSNGLAAMEAHFGVLVCLVTFLFTPRLATFLVQLTVTKIHGVATEFPLDLDEWLSTANAGARGHFLGGLLGMRKTLRVYHPAALESLPFPSDY